VTLKSKTEHLDNITKPIRNVAWLLALIAAGWVQYIGPGLTYQLREMSGSNDLRKEMQAGFNGTNTRLDFIEDNMAPPKILNWLDVRSLGTCNKKSCKKMHSFTRTLYGEKCGIPQIEVEIKILNDNNNKIPIIGNFTPIEGDLLVSRVIHDFEITEYIPNGLHSYQFTLVYPSCEWSREPVPRFSPWFDLVVSHDN